jgi:hypothetical protein
MPHSLLKVLKPRNIAVFPPAGVRADDGLSEVLAQARALLARHSALICASSCRHSSSVTRSTSSTPISSVKQGSCSQRRSRFSRPPSRQANHRASA